jgi:hypothetical protein
VRLWLPHPDDPDRTPKVGTVPITRFTAYPDGDRVEIEAEDGTRYQSSVDSAYLHIQRQDPA